MVEMKGQYQGGKHCEIQHVPSGAKIETDAPKDNAGKGEQFSPTDLVAAALGACATTTMAIFAEKEGLSLAGAKFHITKEMTSAPRRIAALTLNLTLPAAFPPERRSWIEEIANTCPVARSLHPEVKVLIRFEYV